MEFPSGSWEETILPFHGLGSAAFDGEFCNGGGSGFIVGVQGDLIAAPTIVRKSMSDTAWLSLQIGFQKFGPLHGVSAPSANVIYACGSNGMLFKSMDGGDIWTAVDVQTTRNIFAINFYDENRGFAVGDSGLILYTSNGTVTGVNNRDSFAPKKFRLNQNYPNPFNPSTTIEFTIPRSAYVSLKVFNLIGEEVATLVAKELSVGTHEIQWDTREQSSGVYLYRLEAAGFTETKKLVILR